MVTTASILPMSMLEPGVDVLFYSSDEKRAQRLAARLRDLARVQWEDSRLFSPASWRSQYQGRYLVLLDYANDDAPTSTELAHQLLAMAPGLPLFGVGSTASDHAAGVLAALRAGVLDFFDMDASDAEIRELLEHAAKLPTDARPATTPAPRKLGQLVLLLGVRPGVGCSTLAAHLGALAVPPPKHPAGNTTPDADKSASTDAPTPQALLLDLGQPAGDAELYLGVTGEFHYADALRNANRIDATLLRSALSRHGASQLAVLSQDAQAPLLSLDVAEMSVLVERLREHVDLVLCDLGGLQVRQIPASLLHAASEIWLVVDQGIATMVSLDRCLRDLQQVGVRDQRLGLVANRHDDDCGLTPQQIAKRFELPLLAILPNRSRTLLISANQGKLLHQSAPRDPYIRALAPLRERLHIANMPPSPATPWWKRLFQRGGGSPWKTR